MDKFDFVAAYKSLRPTESREIIDARTAAFSELSDISFARDQIGDLSRLAFQLPTSKSALDWFANPMKIADTQFVIEVDTVEAGRIASLLLMEKMSMGDAEIALTILTTHCGGLRQPVLSQLPELALKSLIDVAESPEPVGAVHLEYASMNSSTAHIEAAKGNLTPDLANKTFNAIVEDSNGGGAQFANDVAAVLSIERESRIRLSDELNMLWWYIGEWSKLIDKPRSTISAQAKGIVAGADLASFVRLLPGPYGASAILRKALDASASSVVTLSEAVDALTEAEVSAICSDPPSGNEDIFPFSFALKACRENGSGKWRKHFEEITSLKSSLKLSHHEIALQMYRERTVVDSGLK